MKYVNFLKMQNNLKVDDSTQDAFFIPCLFLKSQINKALFEKRSYQELLDKKY